MSVVANVAINVDSSSASAKLRQFQQQSSAAAKAAQDLQKTTTATGAAANKAGREYQTAANGMRFFIDATGRARKENGQFVTTAEAAAAGLQRQGKAAGTASAAIGKLGSVIASLGAGLAVRKSFLDASALESANSRIQTLTKNYSQLEGIQGVAAAAATKFRLSQTEALTAVTDLGNRLGAQGASLTDIKNIYEGFNTLLANNKVGAAQAASATLQLNQALGSGRLAGEEFNAISEATPQLLDEVARVLGVARGELKDLASDGKISSQVLVQALTNIREKGAQDLEAAFSGAFGATREFQAASTDLSAAIGTQLLPALTPLIRAATELLKVFGTLPGPVKTVIAAVFGLTAALVALAPAISAATSLLAGLSIATLAAVGPWLALAAGIGVAIGALASYQSQAQKTANAAKTGTVVDVVAARNLSVQKGQEISLLERQRQGASGQKRASIDRRLGVLRGEQAGLQSAIRGNTAERVTTAPPIPTFTPGGATGGSTGGGSGGGSKAANDAEKLAQELERSLEAGKQLATQFSRQVLLLKASDDLEKRRLQIQFDYEDRAKQIAELKNTEQQAALALENADIRRLQLIDLQTEALKKQAEEAEKLFQESLEAADFGVSGGGSIADMVGEMEQALKDFISPANQVKTAAEAIGGAFSTSFRDIVTGAKSAQQGIADFFDKIGQALIDYATQAIAQYIALGIARLFAGLDPLASANSNLSGAGALSTGNLFPTGAFAEGGFVTGPTKALIGEGGSDEYVIPANKMAGAMQRYNAGARGDAVLKGASTTEGRGGFAAVNQPTQINISGGVMQFNDTNYIRQDQVPAIVDQASKAGEARALRKLQMSPSARRKVGM